MGDISLSGYGRYQSIGLWEISVYRVMGDISVSDGGYGYRYRYRSPILHDIVLVILEKRERNRDRERQRKKDRQTDRQAGRQV